MESILTLIILPPLFLGPIFYFMFYANDIFSLPRSLSLIYLLALIIGFIFWTPLIIPTLAIAWSIIAVSWLYILWKVFSQ